MDADGPADIRLTTVNPCLLCSRQSHPDEIESAISAQMATVDSQISPFRLRNRYRDGVGTWIVSIAVPKGHQYEADVLEAAAQELGMRVEGFFEYSGDLQAAIRNDLGEPPVKDGLPLTNEDQSCSFCGAEAPGWVHPLDGSKTAFRVEGESWSLPTFWTVCQRCEELIAGGRNAHLAELFREHEADSLDEAIRVVKTFRAADLGAQAIANIPTPR